jgi:hypothetical protein
MDLHHFGVLVPYPSSRCLGIHFLVAIFRLSGLRSWKAHFCLIFGEKQEGFYMVVWLASLKQNVEGKFQRV